MGGAQKCWNDFTTKTQRTPRSTKKTADAYIFYLHPSNFTLLLPTAAPMSFRISSRLCFVCEENGVTPWRLVYWAVSSVTSATRVAARPAEILSCFVRMI